MEKTLPFIKTTVFPFVKTTVSYGVPFRSKLFQVNKKYSNIKSTCYNSQYNVENIKINFKLKKIKRKFKAYT
jgi:hypothetical protein